MEGGPPAKRRCTNRSDFLEDEEWSTLVSGRSTPVRQLEGSSSRFKFDSNVESDDDSNGKWIMEGSAMPDYLQTFRQKIASNTANYIRYVLHQL